MNIIKKFVQQFNKILSNKQQRAIIMLFIMVLFFGFLIFLGRTGNRYDNDVKENINSFDFSLSKIKDGNYHFIYTINSNNVEDKYEGNHYNDKALFNNLENKYLLYDSTYFKDFNGVWSKTEVNELFKFTDVSNIEKILENAMLDNKTEYSNNELLFNYNITTSSLDKIINDLDTDIADDLNTISITTTSDKEAYKIEFNITPYSIYKYNTNTNIILEYSNFGGVEEIKNLE